MLTILLVDDSRDDRVLFDEALKTAGAKVLFRAVETGEEAIAYLSGEGAYSDRVEWPMPDVVFLDIKLPVKSGFDVLEHLRGAKAASFPVVLMMSASVDPKDVRRAYQLLANDYLVKPSSFDGLVDLLKSVDCFWFRNSLFPGHVK